MILPYGDEPQQALPFIAVVAGLAAVSAFSLLVLGLGVAAGCSLGVVQATEVRQPRSQRLPLRFRGRDGDRSKSGAGNCPLSPGRSPSPMLGGIGAKE